ncbi:sugar phosphate isomerase/epimerase family protein [Virgibacillus pantothenticus]|uniref:sugar phosphate isomerase/epimerase family protein n=1 Tax=Virgibacillus pantothenticus TaxID=1473 RepID=UPI0009859690|nr:sugar phosphate isomerase/epimerase family protein [Virgibacillus pantothenticus]
MKISVSMYSLHAKVKQGNLSIIQFLDFANRLSITGVELLDIYWQDKKQELSQVQSALERNGLQVAAYDVTNNFVRLHKEERLHEINKVMEGIYVAKQLGTNIVRVFCGNGHDAVSFDEAKTYIVESLKQCAEVAERERVFLAIENHGLLAGRSEQVLEMIRLVNSSFVVAAFDTGNFLLVHEQPQAALETLKRQIKHVHFKDFRNKQAGEHARTFHSTNGEGFIGVIPGDGLVDLQAIMNQLTMIAYDGWLSIEYEGDFDSEMATQKAVSRLRTLLLEANRS